VTTVNFAFIHKQTMASGILYPFIRPFAKIAIGIYFRKLHIANRERIPQQGPLIIACNHPNSFTEPCIFATYQSRTLHFIVRGDVFKNPIIAWLLRQTNQIPIFRVRDGFTSLRRNDASFAACYEKLSQEESILIFSEGLCVFEKRLRPLQKGTAKIALGTIEKYGSLENFHILPAGITFTHGDQYRGEVMLNIGEPIPVKKYEELNRTDPTRAANIMTQDIAAAIKPLMIHLEDPARDQLYDDLMDLMDSQSPYPIWPVVVPNDERFKRETIISQRLNSWSEEKSNEIREQVDALKYKLKGHSTSLRSLQYLSKPSLVSYLYLILGALPAFLGFLLHAIPFYLAKYIASRFRNEIEFYTPVRMASLLLLALFANIFLSIFAVCTSSWYLLGWSLSAPISGFMAVAYREKWIEISTHLQMKGLNRQEIKAMRQTLLAEIGLGDLK